MRLLLDENVPRPLATTLKFLLHFLLHAHHQVDHVLDLDGWGGTDDQSLYEKAAQAGFAAVLTNDARFNGADEGT